MNRFASSLLSLMLGWFKGILIECTTLFSGNNSAGFSRWFTKNWLFLAVFLVLCGIIVDFVVYLFRWHPQNTWPWSSDKHSDSLQADCEMPSEYFREGYTDGIAGYTFSDTGIQGLTHERDLLNVSPVPSDAISESESVQIAQQESIDTAIESENRPVRIRRSDRYSKSSGRE